MIVEIPVSFVIWFLLLIVFLLVLLLLELTQDSRSPSIVKSAFWWVLIIWLISTGTTIYQTKNFAILVITLIVLGLSALVCKTRDGRSYRPLTMEQISQPTEKPPSRNARRRRKRRKEV